MRESLKSLCLVAVMRTGQPVTVCLGDTIQQLIDQAPAALGVSSRSEVRKILSLRVYEWIESEAGQGWWKPTDKTLSTHRVLERVKGLEQCHSRTSRIAAKRLAARQPAYQRGHRSTQQVIALVG